MHSPIAPRSVFSPLPLALRTALVASLFTAGSLGATDYLWFGSDTALGGAGTWNPTNPNTNGRWRVDANSDLTADNNTDLAWVSPISFTTARAVFAGPAGTYAVLIPNGTTVQANGLSFAVNGYTLTAGNTNSRLNLVGAAPTITVDPAVSATINPRITGTAGLTKLGAGTLVLAGPNTYTGVTTISNGVLSVATIGNGGTNGNLGASSTAAANLVLNGGTLRYTGATASTNRAFTLGTGTASTIDVANSGTTLTLSGVAANSTGGMTKDGAGILVLNNTAVEGYTGATTVKAGTLRFQTQATNGSTADRDIINRASALTVTGGTVDFGYLTEDTGVVTLDGGTLTGRAVNYNNATKEGALGVITTTANANSGFNVRSGTADVVLANPFYSVSGDAPAIGLTKSTNGVAILTKANTYTGPTTITGGTLVVNGSTAQPSSVSVGYDAGANTRGVLAGSGTVNGTVAVSGSGALQGTLSPGAVALDGTASIGVLRTGAQTWNNGGAMEWQVNSTGGTAGSNFDQLQIFDGGLNLTGLGASGFTLRVIGLNGTAPGDIANFVGTWNPNQMTTYSWTLLTTTGGISGFDAGKFQIDLSKFTNSYDPGHGRFFVGLSGTNNLVLTYESIPEPAVYGACLGAMTLGLVGIRNWRRRRAGVA